MAPLWNHTVSWKRNSLGISIYISESLSREENKFKLFCTKQSHHSVIFGNCLRWNKRDLGEMRGDLMAAAVVLIIWLLFPLPQMPFCHYDFAHSVDSSPAIQPYSIFSLFFFFYLRYNHLWRPSSNLFFLTRLYLVQ